MLGALRSRRGGTWIGVKEVAYEGRIVRLRVEEALALWNGDFTGPCSRFVRLSVPKSRAGEPRVGAPCI